MAAEVVALVLTADRDFGSREYLADFTLSTDRDVPVVRVRGGVDSNNISAFQAVMDCAYASDAPAIIVVLDTADYICARAYGVLANAYARLARNERKLLLVAALRSFPRRIIALLELPFSLFDSVKDAIADAHRCRFDRPLLQRDE